MLVINNLIELKSYLVFCLKPYKYDRNRYLGTFFAADAVNNTSQLSTVSSVIYCFWTGDNEITCNRLMCLKSMEDNCGVK